MAKRQRPVAKKPDPNQKPGKNPLLPAGPGKQVRASSFLMGQRKEKEMDKQCGNLEPNDEYVQPDEEKETGGEG